MEIALVKEPSHMERTCISNTNPTIPIHVACFVKATTWDNLIDPDEIRFNDAFKKARVCIEQLFGRLKNKFRILLLEGGGMRLRSLEQCSKLINVCCALWNFFLFHEGITEDAAPEDNDLTVYNHAPVLGLDIDIPAVQLPPQGNRRVTTCKKLQQIYFP